MRDTDLAYIAGIFDGEGCVSYKQYNRQRKHNKKPYPTWQIRLEISMTDRSILVWINETLEWAPLVLKDIKRNMPLVGKSNGVGVVATVMRIFVCCALFPYAHVKLEGIQKIIDHYASRKFKIMNNKVVSLNEYREAMSLE